MRAALLKLARELRMADPELGGEEAYFEALARMAQQAVLYEALNEVVGILFSRLCNPLEPRVAVAFASPLHGCWNLRRSCGSSLRLITRPRQLCIPS